MCQTYTIRSCLSQRESFPAEGLELDRTREENGVGSAIAVDEEVYTAVALRSSYLVTDEDQSAQE